MSQGEAWVYVEGFAQFLLCLSVLAGDRESVSKVVAEDRRDGFEINCFTAFVHGLIVAAGGVEEF